MKDQAIVLHYLFAGLLGYVIGSFPTAYVLVRWKSHIDIRTAGSGNVGTLNSYEVTNSKAVAVIVLALDLLKGLAAVMLVGEVMGNEFATLAWAGIGSLLGHNFSIWLGFKGGRGLATAVGVMLKLGWLFIPVWMLVWFVAYKGFKDVNVGNAVATLGVLLVTLFAPLSWLVRMIPDGAPVQIFTYFIVALVLVILLKLVQPVKEYFSTVRAS